MHQNEDVDDQIDAKDVENNISEDINGKENTFDAFSNSEKVMSSYNIPLSICTRPTNSSPFPSYQTPVMNSPSFSTVSISDAISGINSYGTGLTPEFFYENGTVDRPYTVTVSFSQPKRNREFKISRLSKLLNEGCEYRAIHICLPVPLQDWKKWQASIPQKLPHHLLSFKDRIVWIKGPTQIFWLKDSKLFFQNITCETTQKYIRRLQTS